MILAAALALIPPCFAAPMPELRLSLLNSVSPRFLEQPVPFITVASEKLIKPEIERIINEATEAKTPEKSFEIIARGKGRAKAINDQAGLAFLNLIEGQMRQALNEHEASIPPLRAAIPIFERLNDWEGVVICHSALQIGLRSLGRTEEALKSGRESLRLSRLLKAEASIAALLSQVGLTHQLAGDIDQALGHYEEGLALARKLKDRGLEAVFLANMGFIFQQAGDPNRAITRQEEALKIGGEDLDPSLKTTILGNLGLAKMTLGDYVGALEVFQMALKLHEAQENSAGIALTVSNIGFAAMQTGDLKGAKECFLAVIPLAQMLQESNLEALVRSNLGTALAQEGDRPGALREYGLALGVFRKSLNGAGEALCLSSMGSIAMADDAAPLAISLYKQAVNRLQAMRQQSKSLDAGARESMKRQYEAIYRTLASLLIDAGRLPEAQQALDMLKEEELFQFLQRSSSDGLNQTAALTAREEVWKQKYEESVGKIASAARQYQDLLVKPNHSAEEEKKLAELLQLMEAANQAFAGFLNEMAAAFKSPVVEQIKEDEGLVSDLAELSADSSRTAAITAIALPDSVAVILTTPETRIFGRSKIAAADLARKIQNFRTVLQNPAHDPRPLAKELYDILIRPIEKELQSSGAETLIFSLDGVLRYIPISALHNGEKYLVESHRIGLFTPASRTRLSAKPKADWSIAAFGSSQAQTGFSALPGVPEELDAIAKALPSESFLDALFTREAFLKAMQSKSKSVIHVASHFQLTPGKDALSFLLLGDGSRLTLAEVARLPSRSFDGVELMTLSACSTALGNGDGAELEGFAALAQRKGVRAVLASLWPIDDAGTRSLMENFYRVRKESPDVSKAQALRLAQLAMIQGSGGGQPGKKRGDAIEPDDGTAWPKWTQDPAKPFSHPYYWAPFVLIGNFR